MSPDELVYLGILAASIPVGFLFRYLSEYSDVVSGILNRCIGILIIIHNICVGAGRIWLFYIHILQFCCCCLTFPIEEKDLFLFFPHKENVPYIC